MSLIEVDSCWFADEESSMTCNQIINETPSFELYEHIRVRGYWLIYLPGDAIYAPANSYDTIIDVSWHAIDTIYSELRDSMSSLESSVGSYILRKNCPMADTGEPAGEYSLVFDSLVPPLSVDTMLRRFAGISEIYMSLIPPQISYVPNDPGMQPGVDYYDISTEDNLGVGDIVLPWGKYVHHTGWQWNLYRQKAPLAWEITRGKSSEDQRIVLGVIDDWYHQFEHPDFSNNSSDSRYNFLEIRKLKSNIDDGFLESVLFRNAHGQTVAGMAVANMDNNVGIVGICPDCIVVGYLIQLSGGPKGPREEPYRRVTDILSIDVDGVKDNV